LVNLSNKEAGNRVLENSKMASGLKKFLLKQRHPLEGKGKNGRKRKVPYEAAKRVAAKFPENG